MLPSMEWIGVEAQLSRRQIWDSARTFPLDGIRDTLGRYASARMLNGCLNFLLECEQWWSLSGVECKTEPGWWEQSCKSRKELVQSWAENCTESIGIIGGTFTSFVQKLQQLCWGVAENRGGDRSSEMETVLTKNLSTKRTQPSLSELTINSLYFEGDGVIKSYDQIVSQYPVIRKKLWL